MIMSIQDEIKALKKRIAELEELAKEEQDFPQDGDTYWCVVDGLLSNWSIYEGDYVDRGRKLSGNFFRTREQAHFAVEKLKVEAELRKFSRPFEYGKFNYYLFFDIDGDDFKTDFSSYCKSQGAIYFESVEKVQQAVSTVGEDRIKKYIFGVED